MKITIFGLSITSSWGNGHATTFRALCSALYNRGHRIVFFEHDLEWYRNNRDLPEPEYCETRLFTDWDKVLPEVRAELKDTDVAVVGSYFPDGIAALDEVLESNVPVKAFYDIDTPITVTALEKQDRTDYLLKRHLAELDVYFSFTGGPILKKLEEKFKVRFATPLYCSFDPEKYRRLPANAKFNCDLSYMGTYAPDRQPKIEELLCAPARRRPDRRFIVAGPQYPKSIAWPDNIERIKHVSPLHHAEFYGSCRLTLNVTRRDMVMAGFSPSVRLFEASACAATIVSDNWPGLDSFFIPGKEILLPASGDDVLRYISEYDTACLRQIGLAAQARVMARHTSDARAREFERAVEIASQRNVTVETVS